jgi:hypothetical protein
MSEHQIAWDIVTMLQTNDCRTVPRRFRRRIIPAAVSRILSQVFETANPRLP